MDIKKQAGTNNLLDSELSTASSSLLWSFTDEHFSAVLTKETVNEKFYSAEKIS